MKNILIVAAENSAENYGSKIIDQFKKSNKKILFFGVGGDNFAKREVELIVHNKELSIVGIIEVLSSILRLRRIMKKLVDIAGRRRADGAILIDYPDFNLRLAKKLKKAGIPVYYYISPTIWAWRYSRIKIIRKYVDHMFIIFPFEQDIYKKEKIPFTYTGHPLIPSINIRNDREKFRKELNIGKNEKVIALLPGSRESEIRSLLPEMLETIKKLRSRTKFRVLLLRSDSINNELLEEIFQRSGIVVEAVSQSDRYDLFNAADAAFASCGTSNLELALCGLPFIAVYKVNRLSYLLGKGFLKISLYSIVNILLKRGVVKEFIQNDFTADNCSAEVYNLLTNSAAIKKQKKEFRELKSMLTVNTLPSKMIFNKLVSFIFKT